MRPDFDTTLSYGKTVDRAFAIAWARLPFQYEPETGAGARMARLLHATISVAALKGERDPQTLADQAIEGLPVSISYHARPSSTSNRPSRSETDRIASFAAKSAIETRSRS